MVCISLVLSLFLSVLSVCLYPFVCLVNLCVCACVRACVSLCLSLSLCFPLIFCAQKCKLLCLCTTVDSLAPSLFPSLFLSTPLTNIAFLSLSSTHWMECSDSVKQTYVVQLVVYFGVQQQWRRCFSCCCD